MAAPNKKQTHESTPDLSFLLQECDGAVLFLFGYLLSFNQPQWHNVVGCLHGKMRLWVEDPDWWFVVDRQHYVSHSFHPPVIVYIQIC